MRIFGYHMPGTTDPDGENEQLQRRLDLLEQKQGGGLKALRTLQDEQYNLQSELSAARRKLATVKANCEKAENELRTLRAS
jgi:hypothetical protein